MSLERANVVLQFWSTPPWQLCNRNVVTSSRIVFCFFFFFLPSKNYDYVDFIGKEDWILRSRGVGRNNDPRDSFIRTVERTVAYVGTSRRVRCKYVYLKRELSSTLRFFDSSERSRFSKFFFPMPNL